MIPRIIHQTWKTKDPREWSSHDRRWVKSWQQRNPDYEHQVSDDDDSAAFVAEHFPEHVAAYASLKPVEKADLWRYMVLYVRGGVYTDLDTVCKTPLRDWLLDTDDVVIGLETDLLDEYPDWQASKHLASGGGYRPGAKWIDNPVLFCNWTMASRPEHPLFAEVIRRVVINAGDPFFLEQNPGWTVKKTGPAALTDAIAARLEDEKTSLAEVARRLRTHRDTRVGDIRFLDYDALHTRFVKHVGMGTWKPLGTIIRLWRKARAAVT